MNQTSTGYSLEKGSCEGPRLTITLLYVLCSTYLLSHVLGILIVLEFSNQISHMILKSSISLVVV